MTYVTATFPDVSPFGGRSFTFRQLRRALLGNVAMGLGAVAVSGVLVGGTSLAALWLVGVALSVNPHLHAPGPTGPAVLALANQAPNLPSGTDRFASAGIWNSTAYAPTVPAKPKPMPRVAATSAPVSVAPALPKYPVEVAKAPPVLPQPAKPPLGQAKAEAEHDVADVSHATHVAKLTPLTQVAKLTPPAEAPPAAPPVAPPLPQRVPARAADVPLPRPRPPLPPQMPAKNEPARIPADKPAPRVAVVAPPNEADDSNALPGPDSHTAIYDIAAHTVYMPDGRRLEAHSGLGRRMDNPRYIRVKARGPTPPNVYKLTLRQHLFHGVRAIRLNPANDAKMFGRDGMLAHTYMLGRSGQSNGCVSFKNYRVFLRAFLNGEVKRMVVVAHLTGKPPHLAQRRREVYAYNSR